MKQIISTITLFTLLVLTVVAITKLGSPKTTGTLTSPIQVVQDGTQ